MRLRPEYGAGADAETYVNWNSSAQNSSTNNRENSRKTDGSYKEFSFISNYAVWVTKWRRLAVSHNWRQGLWGKRREWAGTGTGTGFGPIGWVLSSVDCHGPKFNFMPRDTKTKAGRQQQHHSPDDRQSTVPSFQFSFELLIPIPRWVQMAHQRRQVDIQKFAHSAQKNFKLATFA